MSEISKLNGYDIKDATARGSISQLDALMTSVVNKTREIDELSAVQRTTLFSNIQTERIFRIVTDYQIQGSCKFGNRIVGVGYNDTDSVAMLFNSSGDTISTYTLEGHKHCNSIVYDETNEIFYIANGDGTVDLYNNTFEYQDTLTIEDLYAVTMYEDKIYGLKTTKKIYDFEEQTEITLNYNNTRVPQDFTIFNDYIFLLFSDSNCILILDMEGNLIRCLDMGLGNNLFPYGEFESIFVYNNNIYIGSMSYFSESLRDNFLIQYFKTSINEQIDNSASTSVSNYNFYVDSTLRNNPRGTEDSPFNYLVELSLVLMYRKILNPSVVINNFIDSNKLIGTFTANIYNKSSKTILMKIYNSIINLRGDSGFTAFNGNIYNSQVSMRDSIVVACNFEDSIININDNAIVTNGTFMNCKVNINNNRGHLFTATKTSFNEQSFIDPTVTNNTFKSIVSMDYTKPYTITLSLSGSPWNSVSVVINDTRHASINSANGLDIAVTGGTVNIKPTGITKPSGVYLYGYSILR